MNISIQRFGGVAVLAAAMLYCPTLYAQAWATKMFDKLEHDFGDVAKSAKTEYRFQIKNIYLEDMRISSVGVSCGCTTPTLTKRLLKSGETAELVAKFNTDRFEGQHGATLTVRFASPFFAEVRVKVRGYVRRDVVIHPGRIEFGTVDSEVGVQKRAQVLYAGRNDWQLTDIRSDNEHFHFEFNPLNRSAGRVNYELFFNLKPGAPAGYVNEQVTLVTNDQKRQYIPLVVEGRVAPSLTVSPTSLQLGTVSAGESVTKQIVVRGKSAFKVTDIRCLSGNECFSFQRAEDARKLHLIPVTYTALEKAGKYVNEIRIEIDGQDDVLPEVAAHVEVVSD